MVRQPLIFQKYNRLVDGYYLGPRVRLTILFQLVNIYFSLAYSGRVLYCDDDKEVSLTLCLGKSVVPPALHA